MWKRYITFIIILFAGVCFRTQAFETDNPTAHQMKAILECKDAAASTHLMNDLLDEYKALYTASSSKYAECMLWCAYVCADKGDCKQAAQLVDKSDNIYKNHGNGAFDGRDTLAQIFRHEVKAILEKRAGRSYHAVGHLKKALNLKKEHFGEDTEIYLMSLLDISQLYADRLQYGKSNAHHTEGYTAYVKRLKTEFCSTSEYNRTIYWSTASRYISRTLDIAYNMKGSGQKEIAGSAYNAILFSKGLLLNTNRSFEDHVIASGSEKALSILQTRKAYVEKQAPQEEIDLLDYEILRVLKEEGKEFELPHLNITWADVAACLGKDDLAIEFYKTSEGKYCAIVLKSNWKAPKVIRLDEYVKIGKSKMVLERAIRHIQLSAYNDTTATDVWNLSKAIWNDDIVLNFPTGKSGNVYFAADGELLITAIENLPFVAPGAHTGYHTVSDLYNIHRLSSTRELVLKEMESSSPSAEQPAQADSDSRKAVVYGGLKFSMHYKDMVDDAQQYRAGRGLRYLPGTLEEANSIFNTIEQNPTKKLEPKVYSGDEGTEASFKSLSGQDIKLIHIATHGYFYDEDSKEQNDLDLGDHPMSRSGLLFAGADNKWFGDELPQGVDDGFLTSLEISALDFHKTELVVLSACETGKGSIEGDGVFGLQRGFKMAGVKSIIMSLWKVDDDATSRLMIEFYNNWITEGMSKHDALKQAKKTIRANTAKGWDNPFYWAGFILLDGDE